MRKILDIREIRIDGGTQPRAEISLNVINEYMDKIIEGEEFPPMVVFYDGAHYWLADGYHRYHAYIKIKYVDRECEVINGTVRDAQLYSFSANSTHGLQRTNADKRKAVETMLKDEEWKHWTDVAIADKCKVSSHLVGNVRREIQTDTLNIQCMEPEERTFIHPKTGRESQMNVSNIGKSKTNGQAKEEQGLAYIPVDKETGEIFDDLELEEIAAERGCAIRELKGYISRHSRIIHTSGIQPHLANALLGLTGERP